MTLIVALAAVVAVAAAARSTWSPCGLSMLSTITPMAERSRGRRWGLTAAWFILGATLGGATLGALAVACASVVGLLDLPARAVLGTAAVLALVTAGMDLGIGTRMPHHRRQVDELWLDQFRSWVYGIGFGFQIGTGLMTYIMTAAVYLTVMMAALTGSAVTAMALALLFGATRGAAILLGAGLTEPDRLRRFHRRFEALGPAVRLGVIGVQIAVAVVASGAAWGALGAVTAAVFGVAAVLVTRGVQAPAANPTALLVER
ncbi:MAG: hypothetical protein V9E94_02520 [Microthrixaceae bacterium]